MKTVNLQDKQDRRLVEHAAKLTAPRCRLSDGFTHDELVKAMASTVVIPVRIQCYWLTSLDMEPISFAE